MYVFVKYIYLVTKKLRREHLCPLELELQVVVVRHSMDARNQNQVLCKYS